jgi:ribosomal protein L11
MVKNFVKKVKLQLSTNSINPVPLISLALCLAGENIMGLCKELNSKNNDQNDMILPVVILIYVD